VKAGNLGKQSKPGYDYLTISDPQMKNSLPVSAFPLAGLVGFTGRVQNCHP